MVPFEGAKYFPNDDSSKAVLLLHAYTGSPSDVNMLGRLLNRHGYNVLAPLFEGHGQNNIDTFLQARPTHWQHQTRQWIEWLIQQGFQTISVFGLSMGGIFATWAMAQESLPLTSGGVFNSPVVTHHPINIERPFMRYAKEVYNASGHDDFHEVFDEIITGHRMQIQALEQFKESLYKQLRTIDKPFYIAQSGQDELIHPEDAIYLSRALKQADVHYHSYPNCSHVITVNRHRQEFEKDVLAFLKATTV